MRKAAVETIRAIEGKRQAAIVGLGCFLTDLYFKEPSAMLAGAGWSERSARTLQSTFVAPEITDDLGIPSHNLDVAAEIGLFSGSVIVARSTSSAKEVALTAVTAQVFSSGVDGLAAHSGLLNTAELGREDVGSSAIVSALCMKFLMDRLAASEKNRKIWGGAAVAWAGALTLGATWLDSKNGTTDFLSHGAGILTGFGASKLNSRSTDKAESYDHAAANDLVAAVEYS